MLKVKLKALAAEAKIIRHEERRTKGSLRNELWQHRVGVVRNESRHTHIAYGIMRGRTLEQIEPHCKTPFDAKKVEAMFKRYGPPGWLYPALTGGSP